jgi:transposase-like protein
MEMESEVDKIFEGNNTQQLRLNLKSILESQLKIVASNIVDLFERIIKDGAEKGKITILLPGDKIHEESETINKMLTANNKLSPEQIQDIVKRKGNGESWKSLARIFGVSIPTIKYHVKKAESNVTQNEDGEVITTEAEKLSIPEVKKEIESILEKD